MPRVSEHCHSYSHCHIHWDVFLDMTSQLDVVTSSWHSPVKNFMTFFRFSYIFFYEITKTSNFRAYLYVLKDKESNGDKRTDLASTIVLENLDQLPVKEVFEGILMIMSQLLSSCFDYLHYHFDIHVFEFKKSTPDKSTALPYLDDL